ncbi:MAG: DMT family transporter [Alphaproteobacteria bacterium]
MAQGSAQATAPGGRRKDSGLGIAYMACCFLVFSTIDTMSKYLVQELPVLQVAWTRQLGLLLGVMPLLLLRGRTLLQTTRPLLQCVRGLLTIGSSVLFIFAIRFVPLADALAVSFIAPLVVTILGATLLGETVGIRRWTAVAVGFVGAIIVVRPGMGVVHPAALLVLVAASMFAGRQVITRLLGDRDGNMTTMAYTAIAGVVALSLPLPFVWQTPSSALAIGLLAAIAALGAVGEYLAIKALEVAEAVVVAPTQYTLLIWGTVYGYAVFGDLPDGWTVAGAAIIVASTAYTFYRERRLAAADGRGARGRGH